jgi:S-adenosyl methyltransferase
MAAAPRAGSDLGPEVAVGLVLGLVALGPGLRRGFLLSDDMVFVPREPFTSAMFRADGRSATGGAERFRRRRRVRPAPGRHRAEAGPADLRAGLLLSVNPGIEKWARSNRVFVVAAAARATRQGGISQFLDLGAGLRPRPAVRRWYQEVRTPPSGAPAPPPLSTRLSRL